MSGRQNVPARTVALYFETARSKGLPLGSLLQGLSTIPSDLPVSPRDITWSDFVRLLENLEGETGGPEGLREFGEACVASPALGLYHRLGRLLAHPRDLYWLGARWFGPSLFPMVQADVWELEEGRIVERLTLREGYRECPAFFHLMAGSLAAGPQVFGHGASTVELRLEPRRATYLISTNARGHGWIGRLVRALRAPFTMPGMLRELVAQRAEIEEGYTRLFEAHGRIETQATQLERVNSIGQRLAEEIDLDRVADLLLEVMLSELGAQGVELWLIRPTSDPASQKARFFRSGGRTTGAPSSIHLLETASRPVGTLRIWSERPVAAGSNGSLLDRLLPWITMALDNARSYEALERHASRLEDRVKERTARLLTANHHLVKEIEERRRATEALLESEAQLRAAERLASIGTLAAGIAHEINNPIGSILAAAQLAQVTQAEKETPEEISQALDDIVAQAKRCGGIVRSVLQFSRDEHTEKWDCRLSDIISRSIRLVTSPAREHQARIELRGPGQESWARVNPIQIEQAIVNLLRNAIESGGRKIEVELRADVPQARAAIVIRDDGPGIPEADQHRVLEPFYTTKRPLGGTGLGLSVVHGIAVEHGGHLEIESGPDGGTLAILELPTVAPPLPSPTPTEIDEKPPDRRPSEAPGALGSETGRRV